MNTSHEHNPSRPRIMQSLLRADFTTQWRNRRALILVLIVPIIILFSWHDIVVHYGGAFAVASCITIGLVAVGLMGYSNTLARDREKGILERLRVTPASGRDIMSSRLIIQLGVILLMTLIVFVAAYFIDQVTFSPLAYVVTIITALLGGTVYLGLGQTIVGLIRSAETVNSTTRLIYFILILVGTIGELGVLGNIFRQIILWTPYGTVKTMLSGSMALTTWTTQTTLALLATIAYGVIFAVIGIQKFKWTAK